MVFFHVQVHVGALAELMGEAEADVVPRAFVFVSRAEKARGVAGFNVLIAEEFMEHVGLDVEGALFADVLTETEADAAQSGCRWRRAGRAYPGSSCSRHR